MTEKTCAHNGCRRPPVKGSEYCAFHLAERTRKARDILGIITGAGGVLVAIGVAIIKIVGGRKS